MYCDDSIVLFDLHNYTVNLLSNLELDAAYSYVASPYKISCFPKLIRHGLFINSQTRHEVFMLVSIKFLMKAEGRYEDLVVQLNCSNNSSDDVLLQLNTTTFLMRIYSHNQVVRNIVQAYPKFPRIDKASIFIVRCMASSVQEGVSYVVNRV